MYRKDAKHRDGDVLNYKINDNTKNMEEKDGKRQIVVMIKSSKVW